MSRVQRENDQLLGGFYTVSEAARLLGIGSRQRIYHWLQTSVDQPLIERDYKPINKTQELSFWDLIEVRFVDHFRNQGLSLQFLRKVANKAREEFGIQHPFALSKSKFLTDRKRIFQQTAEQEDEKKTLDILSGQYEMYETIEEALSRGVAFDPKTALAKQWKPVHEECPNVIVDPRFAYGHPVVGKKKIPTAALYRQWLSEERDIRRVSEWFGTTESAVEEAIAFETRLTV